MDHYAVLEVDVYASSADIKKAYHRLAKIYHPDKNPDDKDSFQAIQNAYEVLSDPEKRELYDSGVDCEEDYIPTYENPLHDIFDDFFLNGGYSPEPLKLFRKTEDMNITLKVSLEDLYQRKKKRITFSRMRLDGLLYIKDKMKVKIAVEDALIILPGEADEAVGFEECGDVVIRIETTPHKKFKRIDSYDIIYKEKIPVAAIYSDYYFTVQHLDGQPLYLVCKANTLIKKDNIVQKVQGYGLPISKLDRDKVKRGDLYIEYEIQYPESIEELRKSKYTCNVNKNQKTISIATQISL